jgi:glycosyltransferase involved in cell wall biosynthesis
VTQTAKRLLVVAQDGTELIRSCRGHRLDIVGWPESGRYGSDVPGHIASACSRIEDVVAVDCVICENLSSAPVLFHLRKQGYTGPVIIVPHVNPYPVRNLVHTLLWSQVWGAHDVVVAGSPATAQRYESLFGMRSQPLPTYGVDESVFSPGDRDDARCALRLPGGPLMVYTGRFARDKNIGGLIATYTAVRRFIPDVQLVMAVRFTDAQYRAVLGSQLDGVRIMEDLAPPELAELYRAADVFVSCATSYHETFGMSPAEALACGIPVVLPDWDGFRSYTAVSGARLVPVNFLDEPLYERCSYAMVDLPAMVRTCVDVLTTRPSVGAVPKDRTRGAFEAGFNKIVQAALESTGSWPGGRHRYLQRTDPRVDESLRELDVDGVEDLFRLATCAEPDLPTLTPSASRNLYVSMFG